VTRRFQKTFWKAEAIAVENRTGDHMTETRHANTTEPRLEAAGGHSGSFLIGLFGGAVIGTAAGVLFAPQIYASLRNVRRQLADAAADASDAAAEKYRQATTRVGDTVDDLQQKARGVYAKALSAVVRGAEDVKERATEAQTELDQSAALQQRRSS
jgi:gas vesicle protein